MPSSFSTPDDKSTPNGFILSIICLILFVLIPPDKNHCFLVSRCFNIFQSKLLEFPPGKSPFKGL